MGVLGPPGGPFSYPPGALSGLWGTFWKPFGTLNRSRTCLENTCFFKTFFWVYLGLLEAHVAALLEPILAFLDPLCGLWICLQAQFGIHLGNVM